MVSCRKNPDVFCYLCGEYNIAPNRKPVTSFITPVTSFITMLILALNLFTRIKLGRHTWCAKRTPRLCVGRPMARGVWTLEFPWFGGGQQTMSLTATSALLMWLGSTERTGAASSILIFNQHIVIVMKSARRHCDEIPVPIFGELPDISDEDTSSFEGHEDEEVALENDAPHPFPQKKLNDLIRDLSFTTDSAELLASRLKEKKVLSDSARISFFRNRHQEYLRFFSSVKDLVYCADIAQLLLKLEVPQYEPKDWRLFIDSSKQSLKCVLLHNGNQFASVPIAHSTTQEKYEAVKYVLEKIGYDQH